MGRSRKFSDLELAEAIKAGLTRQEICARFGVSKSTLCEREKRLNLAASKAALLHQGKELAQGQIDAQAQLLKINQAVHRWIDRLEGVLASRPQQEAAEIIAELKGWERELYGDGDKTPLTPIIARLEKLAVVDLEVLDRHIKYVAEGRKQLELMVKAAAELLEAKRLAQVQQIILQEIGAESAECKSRIIHRLGGLTSSGLLFGPDGWA